MRGSLTFLGQGPSVLWRESEGFHFTKNAYIIFTKHLHSLPCLHRNAIKIIITDVMSHTAVIVLYVFNVIRTLAS